MKTAAPLYVWVTRPDAYDIYTRGVEKVLVWVDEPYYSHAPKHAGTGSNDDEHAFVDTGWWSKTGGTRARSLLRQDDDLLEAVWDHLMWTCAPQGMDRDEVLRQREVEPDRFQARLRQRTWEARCNRCVKRTLVKVDLRSGAAELIAPQVALRSRKDYAPGPLPRITTISRALALQVYQARNEASLPF